MDKKTFLLLMGSLVGIGAVTAYFDSKEKRDSFGTKENSSSDKKRTDIDTTFPKDESESKAAEEIDRDTADSCHFYKEGNTMYQGPSISVGEIEHFDRIPYGTSSIGYAIQKKGDDAYLLVDVGETSSGQYWPAISVRFCPYEDYLKLPEEVIHRCVYGRYNAAYR